MAFYVRYSLPCSSDFAPYIICAPYVSTSTKNVRGGHKNPNFSKKSNKFKKFKKNSKKIQKKFKKNSKKIQKNSKKSLKSQNLLKKS
jgi:hypothetical protein